MEELSHVHRVHDLTLQIQQVQMKLNPKRTVSLVNRDGNMAQAVPEDDGMETRKLPLWSEKGRRSSKLKLIKSGSVIMV